MGSRSRCGWWRGRRRPAAASGSPGSRACRPAGAEHGVAGRHSPAGRPGRAWVPAAPGRGRRGRGPAARRPEGRRLQTGDLSLIRRVRGCVQAAWTRDSQLRGRMAVTVVVRSGPGLPVRCGTRLAPGRRQGAGLTVSWAGNAPGVAGVGAGRSQPARLWRAVYGRLGAVRAARTSRVSCRVSSTLAGLSRELSRPWQQAITWSITAA